MANFSKTTPGSGGDLRDWARDALFVGETYVLEVPPSATLRPQSREFVVM